MSRTVLVTGSNRGLGLEFVKQFSDKGYKVIATCRRSNKAKELHGISGDIEIKELDVEAENQLRDLKDELLNNPIDIIVLNAEIVGQREIEIGNIDIDNMIDTFKINAIYNLKIIERLFQNVLLGKEKKIVVISSSMGSIESNKSGGYYSYRGSKAALNAMIKSVAIDQEKNGIKFLILHPGWVGTEMGGPNADIDVTESISGMIKVIEGDFNTGDFLDYKGHKIQW
ncbi:MAG: SDR family oxidoreductase [Rickettsiales bacterium]|nr:SDR family oxidoreductase [Rickettsiales bacterium]